MTCIRQGGAIVCGRFPAARRRPSPPTCRHPDCSRRATQAGYACRAHWFKLPMDLRSRMFHAATAVPGRPQGQAWEACAIEADNFIAEQLARPPAASWRQPELPL